MREFGHIYLSWRQGFGKGRHIVGVLRKNATEGVRFAYLADGVKEAMKDGFTPYTEFPQTDKEYKDNVLEIFGQRIMKSDRADISDFLDFWEISPRFKDDKYHLLAHTQGLNPTDNFEFLADYNPIKSLRFLTDLAGLSVLKLPAQSIKPGDKLSYCLDIKNEFDKSAVKVFLGETHIGYIKKVHNKVFHKMGPSRLSLIVKAVEQNGVVKRVFVKVFTA